MRALFILIVSFVFLFSATAAAEPSAIAVENTKNPKICLVLSGGGARGFAHVGVLKELEALRIPIHCIAGTSMGAVVGGLYAAGLSASEIEERLNKLKLNDIALDRVPRRHLPQALREEDTQYPLGATLGLSSTGVRLPTGAVQATQFLELLHNWTAHLQPDIDFDQLPIPFRAVATDLENGKMILLKKGPLHAAIRASMAAPGVFSPVEIDGRLLTDGGLVRNLPVDIARNMGADIIIAVNIGTHLLQRNQLTSLLNVSQQMVNILTEQNVEHQKAGLRPKDILIEPDLGNISFMDFGRYTEAATIGEKSAIAMHATLSALSVTPEQYSAMQNRRPHSELPAIKISFVEIESNGLIPKQEISRQVSVAKGSTYNAEEINQQLALLNITREYDGINHELVQRNGEYGVRINANERKWGPHFLRFGMALSSGYDGTGGFRLHVGHRQPWVNDSGLEWRNDLEFGNALGMRSELRQPVFERDSIFFAPFADVKRNTRNLFNGETRIAEYDFRRYKIGADFGIPLGNRNTLGEFRIGLGVNHYRVSPKLGAINITAVDGVNKTIELPSGVLQQAGINTSVIVDQLSDATFPRHGYEFDSNLFLGMNNSGDNYKEFAINGNWAESIDSHTVNVKLGAAGLFQSSKEVRGVGPTLGGFQQLSAFQPDQFTGNYMLYGSATYLYRALKFDLAGQSLFVGSSIEMGNVWNRGHEISFASTRKSASLFAGFNSFMGPIYFGVALGTAGAKSIFFQLERQ